MSDMLTAKDLMSLEMRSAIQHLVEVNDRVLSVMNRACKAGESCNAPATEVVEWKKDILRASEEAARIHRALDTVLFLHGALKKRNQVGDDVAFPVVEGEENSHLSHLQPEATKKLGLVATEFMDTLVNELNNQSEWKFDNRYLVQAVRFAEMVALEFTGSGGEGEHLNLILELRLDEQFLHLTPAKENDHA